MKICKNEFDIRLCPLPRCPVCAIRTKTRPCLWVVAGLPATIQCGGIRVNVLSDIFKL
jgi:hypothetical protein